MTVTKQPPVKCARTACHNNGTCKHRDLPGLYCLKCAKKINEYNPMYPPLVEVPSKELLMELKNLTRTNVLKTDEEAARDRERVGEIVLCFQRLWPEEVFEDFGHWL